MPDYKKSWNGANAQGPRREKMETLHRTVMAFFEDTTAIKPLPYTALATTALAVTPGREDGQQGTGKSIELEAFSITDGATDSLITINIHADGRAQVVTNGWDGKERSDTLHGYDAYSPDEACRWIVAAVCRLDPSYFGTHLDYTTGVDFMKRGPAPGSA